MSRPRASLQTFGTAGTVAIEYAMVLPVMLMFTFGTMDAARLLWTGITLNQATDKAARCGAVNSASCSTALIESYAASYALGLSCVSPGLLKFTATAPACGEQVVGTCTFQFIAPWFGRTKLPLTATACYPKQQ